MILDDAEIAAAGDRDLPLAMRAAQRASEVTQQKDAAIEDTLARAHFETGNIAKAIEIQTRAIEIASEEQRPELSTTLDRYKKALTGPK
jgi:Flp pilus assembly protein TadD